MGKPVSGGGGGGGGANIFTTNKASSGNYGASLYVDLGVIPTGYRLWFGTGQYSSPSKAGTFELRTNALTKSAGNDSDTLLLGTISTSSRNTTVTQDYYKNNSIHTVSVIGSGVERVWLKIKSKSATMAEYFYSINYTQE